MKEAKEEVVVEEEEEEECSGAVVNLEDMEGMLLIRCNAHLSFWSV